MPGSSITAEPSRANTSEAAKILAGRIWSSMTRSSAAGDSGKEGLGELDQRAQHEGHQHQERDEDDEADAERQQHHGRADLERDHDRLIADPKDVAGVHGVLPRSAGFRSSS